MTTRRVIALAVSLVAAAPRAAAAQDAPPTPAEAPPTPPPFSPLTPLPPPAEVKPVDMLPRGAGAAGPCRAHRDCDPLRCLRHVCVDEATFATQRPPMTAASKDEGARFYLGASLGGVLPVLLSSNAGEGVQGALRGGVMIDRLQLQVEVAPASTVLLNVSNQALAAFEAAGTVGYLIRLNDAASWVVRAGGGGGAIFGGGPVGSIGFGEVRVDVFGVAVRTSDHFFVELDAPSYRILFPTGGLGVSMMWVTSLAVTYVF